MQLHGWGKVEGGKLVFRYYQISAICYSLFYAYASSSFMHVAQKILGGKIKFQLQLTHYYVGPCNCKQHSIRST